MSKSAVGSLNTDARYRVLMGEAKRKSRNRAQILAGEERCVYCLSPPTTVEHMPPKAMFPNRQRLSGMEFAACEPCNHTSRAADTAAAFIARLTPSNRPNMLELNEARRFLVTMTSIAPEFVRELFVDGKVMRVWEKGRDPVIGPMKRIELDGPVATALLRAFSAKIGMALFKEHIGHPLPEGGVVFTQHYLNQGLMRREAEALVSILPTYGELQQGRQFSGRQFNYRYNTDSRSIVGAFAAFNNNFFVRVFATNNDILASGLQDIHCWPPVPVGGLVPLSQVWMPTRSAHV